MDLIDTINEMASEAANSNVLWRLPLELREQIYAETFACHEQHAYCIWKDGIMLTLVDGRIYRFQTHRSHNLGRSTRCGSCGLGLLRTCHYIYQEALPIFHHTVGVKLHIDGRYRSPWEGQDLGAVEDLTLLRNARVWDVTVRLSRAEDYERLIVQLKMLSTLVAAERVEWRSISVQISRHSDAPEVGAGVLEAVRSLTGVQEIEEIKDPWREGTTVFDYQSSEKR